jgi:hypothetical protein
MRILYLAIAAIAVAVVTFSGARPNGYHQQMSLLAVLAGERARAMPDKLAVGDQTEPPSFVSSR